MVWERLGLSFLNILLFNGLNICRLFGQHIFAQAAEFLAALLQIVYHFNTLKCRHIVRRFKRWGNKLTEVECVIVFVGTGVFTYLVESGGAPLASPLSIAS